MKDELDGKVMTGFVPLRPKIYRYLTDENDEDHKAKDTKRCVIIKNWRLKIINIV